MDFKRLLSFFIRLLLLLAMGALLVTCVKSFWAGNGVDAEDKQLRLDVSHLKPGDYYLTHHPQLAFHHRDADWRLMIYRSLDGPVRVWSVPVKNGKVAMPERKWQKPQGYLCFDFGPTKVGGKVEESLPITCHDAGQPENWFSQRWQWNIAGEALDAEIAPMISLQVREIDGELVFADNAN